MAVITETFTRCVACGKRISLQSPPSKRQYNKAQIHIHSGILLLPDAIVKQNHKDGYCDGHTASLGGYYCGPECLSTHIAGLLQTQF